MESGSNYELYLGDCFKVLKDFPSKSVDHIFTDPPFGEEVHKNARSGRKKQGHVTNLLDFNYISEDRFLTFCEESLRICKRWIVMTCDFMYAAKAKEVGLPVIRIGVWAKPNPTPQFSGDRPAAGWEAVLIMHDVGRKWWNGGGRAAIWYCTKVQSKLHKTEKPLELLCSWVELFSDKNELILDPFMGVGTTGVAALSMNRKFIGIEIDPKWFVIAKERMLGKATDLRDFMEKEELESRLDMWFL